MRLKATDRMAADLIAVLLNGKYVPMAHEADTEEGWVTSYMPHLPENLAQDGAEILDSDRADMFLVKQEGLVELVFPAEMAPSLK